MTHSLDYHILYHHNEGVVEQMIFLEGEQVKVLISFIFMEIEMFI